MTDSTPERRCIASGRAQPKDCMVRFVLGPEGEMVPDVAGRLPGRGFWLSAERDMVNTACAKGLFAKATRRRVAVPADLADRVERQLTRRCLDLVGLARRAGQAVAGYEKARQWLLAGKAGVVLAAADGAPASRGRIGALAPELPEIGLFSGEELGAVWGRERTVHVVLAPGGLAERLLAEAGRLAGFRAASGEGASLDQGSMARA